ncbi:MAG: hypothetical protein ABI901_06200 [Roseiflexaceae bacterium]
MSGLASCGTAGRPTTDDRPPTNADVVGGRSSVVGRLYLATQSIQNRYRSRQRFIVE